MYCRNLRIRFSRGPIRHDQDLYRHGEKMSAPEVMINQKRAPKSWSIRHQIAVPLLAIQAFFAFLTAMTGVYVASNRVESEIIGRLAGLSNVLSNPQFPLTESVLQRLHQLTGADFISFDDQNRPIHSSLSDLPRSLPQSKSSPDRLANAPRVRYQDMEYFSIAIPVVGQNRRLIALYPVRLWQRTRREALVLPLLLGIIGLVAMTAVTALVARRISTRLSLVETGVARIAGGQFEELILNSGKNDEIEQLVCSINHMSRQIQEMQKTIEITGRMRVLAQIASGLAHQLRNSIAGARMAIQLHFRRCPISNSDESIGMALKQLKLTEEQVRALISQAPATTDNLVVFDMTGLIQETISLLEFHASHARVHLKFESTEQPCQLLGDPAEYRTAVFNLVNNAIEAAHDDGHVQVKLALMETGEPRLQIIDNGPGFSSCIPGEIGQPFVSSKPEGLGLGLYLAIQVAHRHKSKLQWRREDEHTIFEWIWPADSMTDLSHSQKTKTIG